MRGLFISILLFFVIPAPALAGGADPARVQFKQGVEFFNSGKFEKAAIAFARAYELKPSYKILYNVGQVENELEHYAAALEAYQRYLKEGSAEVSGERLAEVEKEIGRLRTLVGTLEIKSETEGATVQIDGEVIGTTPLSEPLIVDMGKHEVRVLDGALELHREVLKIAGGQEIVIEVSSQATAEMADGGSGEGESDETQPKRLWTWVAAGIGGASLISGAVIGGVSMKKRSDLEGVCTDDQCPPDREDEIDQGKKLSLTADVLYGVAAVGLAAGVALFFLEPKWGESTDETGNVAVVPSATSRSAGIAVMGSF